MSVITPRHAGIQPVRKTQRLADRNCTRTSAEVNPSEGPLRFHPLPQEGVGAPAPGGCKLRAATRIDARRQEPPRRRAARAFRERKAIPLDLPSCGRGKKSAADGIWRTESALPAFFV